jgi:hypothetical protein
MGNMCGEPFSGILPTGCPQFFLQCAKPQADENESSTQHFITLYADTRRHSWAEAHAGRRGAGVAPAATDTCARTAAHLPVARADR